MAEKPINSSTYEITYYLNVENAKIIAFVLVVGFVAYHGIIQFNYGNDSCKWLLSDGRFPGYNTWQPYGCMTHKYTKMDSRMCMRYISYWGGRTHISFLGDSRIRQLFFEFVNLISNKGIAEYPAHDDIHFHDAQINAKVDFIWSPMVNTSMFYAYKSMLTSEPRKRPNLLITGSATWTIKDFNASKIALKNFEVNLTLIKPFYDKLKPSTQIIWMIQDPVVEEYLDANRSMITNEQIDDYNKVALQILEGSSAKIWRSSRLVGQGLKKESKDGLHIAKNAIDLDSQMLLNLYCNNHMNYHDGTCCNNPEQATTLQIVTLAFFLVCMVSAVALIIYRKRKARRNGIKARTENGQRNGNGTQKENNDSCYIIVVNLAKLGLIMVYFYLCDRTNVFMKENKHYTKVNFFLPFAYVAVLGFFFTENTDQTAVLHRDQTDEWKGWMQLLILIYHITGASKVLPIYMHIRVLVSAYLFLTGFGHFTYFWKKGSFGFIPYCSQQCDQFPFFRHVRKNSLHRVLEVLFRYNMLVVVLCFVMNRPYQFYYFVPLVSFWFLVVYVTMGCWPHLTEASAEENTMHYFYMILKFIVLILIISLFCLSEVFFEKIFLTRPLKALFVTQDDSIHEWRFRWMLDRFSVVYGMIFAFAYQFVKKYQYLDDTHDGNLMSHGLTVLMSVIGVLGIGGYALFTFLCEKKVDCNDAHPYLTLVPIMSYAILRNVPGWIRMRYSAFFAWFGKISLELFISQYHIWLAADTYGVLVLIPSYPVFNVVITSFILICISHEISKITITLAHYVVPEDWKSLLRNIIVFVAVLIPLCIANGVIQF